MVAGTMQGNAERTVRTVIDTGLIGGHGSIE